MVFLPKKWATPHGCQCDKDFHIISRIIHFDNREDRPARRQRDKLASIKTVWDKWVQRLSLFYNPEPNVIIDEQLMSFRGRCPFRQYIPFKPAKYGTQIWAACDATSSYAWNLQVYTGKPDGGHPEKIQGMRSGTQWTHHMQHIFYVVKAGTGAPKEEADHGGNDKEKQVPPQLLPTKTRLVNSPKFVYTADTSLVSYVPKKRKNVILMSTLHWNGRISGLEHQKPEIIMDYNATKGGQHRQTGVCLQL